MNENRIQPLLLDQQILTLEDLNSYPHQNKYDKHPERDIRPDSLLLDFGIDLSKYEALTNGSNFKLLSHQESLVTGLVTLRFLEKIDPEFPPQLVYLDKSARPMSWIFYYLWQRIYGSNIPTPPINYLNIGTEKYDETIEQAFYLNHQQFSERIKRKASTISIIKERLMKPRKNHLQTFEPNERFDTYCPSFWIVDDAKNTGISIQLAKALLDEAITQAHVTTNIYKICLFPDQSLIPWWQKDGSRDNWKGVTERASSNLHTQRLSDPSLSLLLRGDLKLTSSLVFQSLNYSNSIIELLNHTD